MGNSQDLYKNKGYTIKSKTTDGCLAFRGTSKEEMVHIKKIKVSSEEASEVKILEATNHPHVVGYTSFKDKEDLHVVMDYCEGGNLAQKIQEKRKSGGVFEINQILQWIVQICMALMCIHKNGLLHKDLRPKRIYLTKFGTVRLGGFGKLKERNHAQSPETLANGTCDAKSDIWSMGCVLYELCTMKSAFTSKTTSNLVAGNKYPTLPEDFSADLRQLLNDIFQRDPALRPTASKILERPSIIRFLSSKNESTIKELQAIVVEIRKIAHDLEKMHTDTTIVSLAGGVIGAAGSIACITGIFMVGVTMGTSLIVTAVGLSVAVAGGAIAGIGNITNKAKKNIIHQNIKNMMREFTEKLRSVQTSLLHTSQVCRREEHGQNLDLLDSEGDMVETIAKVSGEVIGSLSAAEKLAALVAESPLKVVPFFKSLEVVGGVLAILALAVDVFFIALDAREIHLIRQAKASKAACETEMTKLLQSHSCPTNIPKTMQCVWIIEQKANDLQEIVDDLSTIRSN